MPNATWCCNPSPPNHLAGSLNSFVRPMPPWCGKRVVWTTCFVMYGWFEGMRRVSLRESRRVCGRQRTWLLQCGICGCGLSWCSFVMASCAVGSLAGVPADDEAMLLLLHPVSVSSECCCHCRDAATSSRRLATASGHFAGGSRALALALALAANVVTVL